MLKCEKETAWEKNYSNTYSQAVAKERGNEMRNENRYLNGRDTLCKTVSKDEGSKVLCFGMTRIATKVDEVMVPGSSDTTATTSLTPKELL